MREAPAMTSLKRALLAAIMDSLLRGKSLIQAILDYWVSPLALNKAHVKRGHLATKPLDDFLKEAEAALIDPISTSGLLQLSTNLKRQFVERLEQDTSCMLPSFSHQLPTGSECGQYVALDVGGSTMRVALVELQGGETRQCDLVSIRNVCITQTVKDLKGMAFFDWMAARIQDTLSMGLKREHSPEKPLPVALAWSFPVEQTSLDGGKLLYMGKGFHADQGLVGEDLGHIIKLACAKRHLHVELGAILNDSSACLLSRAYSHISTRFSLILGTGLNMAAFLPVMGIGRHKFGLRPANWFDEATHVIVNTELSMFGHDILPLTKWDQILLQEHSRPDFQPLEHLVSGMYLGEIARLILTDAVETVGIFGGILPASLSTPYSLDTETLSVIEGDETPGLYEAIKIFSARHPSSHTPTASDMAAIKAMASFISKRSSALVATCVFTMWEHRLDAEKAYISSLPQLSPARLEAEADMKLETTTVAFNGSVIERYHGYLDSCQKYLDDLIRSRSLSKPRSIRLVPTKESSLMGAAVALACVERGG